MERLDGRIPTRHANRRSLKLLFWVIAAALLATQIACIDKQPPQQGKWSREEPASKAKAQ